VTNWQDYDGALRQRGSLTGWFIDEAIAGWRAHANRDDAVEAPVHRSVVHQLERDAICHALGFRASPSHVQLFRRQSDSDHPGAIVARQGQSHAAPAAADVEHCLWKARYAAVGEADNIVLLYSASRPGQKIDRRDDLTRCDRRLPMPLGTFVEEADASPEVLAVYDDIKKTRDTDYINNFWKIIANDPKTLRRTWNDLKEVMAPGALDPLTKELVYLAVSITNGCEYCTVSHTAGARKAGMTKEMREELIAVIGMANDTNRLANAYRVESDPRFVDAASTL
jgi:AhpD family alkylhydroperoxidase